MSNIRTRQVKKGGSKTTSVSDIKSKLQNANSSLEVYLHEYDINLTFRHPMPGNRLATFNELIEGTRWGNILNKPLMTKEEVQERVDDTLDSMEEEFKEKQESLSQEEQDEHYLNEMRYPINVIATYLDAEESIPEDMLLEFGFVMINDIAAAVLVWAREETEVDRFRQIRERQSKRDSVDNADSGEEQS